MNRHFLILSLMLNCIVFYSGQSAIAGDSLLLNKSTHTVDTRIGIFKITKSTQSEKTVFKPLSINIDGSKALTKFVTPGGSIGKNDTFVFQAYNPRDLYVSGKIYSLKSRLVATMQNIDKDNDIYTDMEWNPNAGSQRAKGGVYIYQIVIGVKVYKGTVIVIR